ncbi:MAG: alpha/beta hydrolase family protein [Nitrososphaeraceae archaeon]
MNERIDIPVIFSKSRYYKYYNDENSSNIILEGNMIIPKNLQNDKLIIFVHGSGSRKTSIRNQYLSHTLNKNGFSTLVFDLLTKEEQESDDFVESRLYNSRIGINLNKFNINLLTKRLLYVTEWMKTNYDKDWKIGYFAASTGTATALNSLKIYDDYNNENSDDKIEIKTLVSRSGRPDLISFNNSLFKKNKIPILFLIGENDDTVKKNTSKFTKNLLNFKIEIIKNANHLFEEKGQIEQVSLIANKWFLKYLK